MIRILGVSEVRRRLHRLLEAVHERPEQRFRIAVHGVVVAELGAPSQVSHPGSAAAALLRLSPQRAKGPRRGRAHTRVAEEHDRYLYGHERGAS